MSRDRLPLLGGAAVAPGAIVVAQVTVKTDKATQGGSKVTRTVGDIDDGLYQT